MKTVTFIVLTVSSFLMHVQSPAQSFEVASIRPSAKNDRPQGDCAASDSKVGRYNPGLGRCVFQRMTLMALISTAYSPVFPGGRLGFPMDRIEVPNDPALRWISSQPFDIQAKAAEPAGTTESQLYVMLQQLLSDGFGLRLRHTTKNVKGYALLTGGRGPKVQVAAVDDKPNIGGGPPGLRPIFGRAVPITSIANLLARSLGSPVEDHTGLTGLYNWQLAWSPDESEVRTDSAPIPSPSTAIFPSLTTAVQEQLGLRLESRMVQVDILIIESARKPLPN